MTTPDSFFDYAVADGGEPQPMPEDRELLLLAGLSEQDWERIREHSQLRRYRAGDTVIEQGDRGRDLFIVLSGTLHVQVGKGRLVGGRRQSIPAGSVIGEVAFFTGGPRTARIVADEDSELLRLGHEQFEILSAQNPVLGRTILLELGRVLAVRLIRSERSAGAR
jgi:CRP-like cAMP-binding protein